MVSNLSNENQTNTNSNTEEQRSEERFEIPIIVNINGTDYAVQDWSAGGFQVQHFDRSFQVGDCLPIHLSFNFKGGSQFSLDILAEVVWRSRNKRAMGFRFLNLRGSEKQLLQQIGEDLKSGKLTPADPAINPEKLVNKKEGQQPAIPQKKTEKGRQFWLTTAGLSLLGLAVLSVTGVALYRAIAFMHIDSAAIARSYKEVISTHRGQLSQLYVSEGMKVEAGDPLFRVYDEQMAQFVAEDEARNIQQLIRDKTRTVNRLQEKLEVTRTEREEAKANLSIARSRQKRETQNLNVSKQVTQKQLQQAQAQVQALETQYQSAQRSLERADFLQQQGAIAEARVDEAKAQLAEVQGELQQARKEVEIKQNILATIDQGSFYTGRRFNGNLPELEAQVEQASARIAQKSKKIKVYQGKIKQQQQQIQELEQQYRNQNFQLPQPKLSDPSKENIFSQVYNASVNATVAKIEQAVGQSMNIGETVLILQPERDRIRIDAFLTQDQATRVSVGRKVKVTVPDLDKTYHAEVTKIDRSGGLRDEIRGRYQFEGSTTRPAYIQLVILDATQEDRRLLTPGTPVELTVQKPNYL
jgi:multidrug resistance efflux pump